jgi:hypothetical protein
LVKASKFHFGRIFNFAVFFTLIAIVSKDFGLPQKQGVKREQSQRKPLISKYFDQLTVTFPAYSPCTFFSYERKEPT